jgi:hypothetical protein
MPDNIEVSAHINLSFFHGPYILGVGNEPPNIGRLVVSPADPNNSFLPTNLPSVQININLPVDQFMAISVMRNSWIKILFYVNVNDKDSPSIKYHADGHETWYLDWVKFEEEIPSN